MTRSCRRNINPWVCHRPARTICWGHTRSERLWICMFEVSLKMIKKIVGIKWCCVCWVVCYLSTVYSLLARLRICTLPIYLSISLFWLVVDRFVTIIESPVKLNSTRPDKCYKLLLHCSPEKTHCKQQIFGFHNFASLRFGATRNDANTNKL